MARFGIDNMDKYGSAKNNYFSLRDDKDTATIRFLYNDINDVQGVAVHEVTDGDKKIDVECIRDYNEPVDKCPLCANGHKVLAKLYIPVYDETDGTPKVWNRGKSFFAKLSSLCARYSPLVSMPFEIERNGKKGDTNTTYEIFPTKADKSIITDFPEPEIEGSAFFQKTYEELESYVATGTFENITPRRTNNRTNTTEQSRERTSQMPVRRRPNYSEEDNF